MASSRPDNLRKNPFVDDEKFQLSSGSSSSIAISTGSNSKTQSMPVNIKAIEQNKNRKHFNKSNQFQNQRQPNSDDENDYNKDDDDDDGDDVHNESMSASYSEIAFHSNFAISKTTINSDVPTNIIGRNNSNLDKPISRKHSKRKVIRNIEAANNSNYNSDTGIDNDKNTDDEILDDIDKSFNCDISGINKTGPFEQNKSGPDRPISLVCDNSFPYNLEGTVSTDGDMTHFVAENLEYKIKLSSPVSKKDYPGLSSRNSTPSTSGLITRQFLLPQQLQQIDSNVLDDVEIEAQYLAASLDSLTENLCNLLHSISSITADNVEIHKNSVNKLTDCMDANIKSMYTIMAKTEEITKSMKPTEQLAQRIREVKRLVDMLESNL